jgi:GNAT superfamily N-acetyltransferase
MADWVLEPLNRTDHALEVLDLTRRAADYVTLEVARSPDLAFVVDFFEATPPGVTKDKIYPHGIRQGGRLIGIVGIAEGYEFPTDWWIGLMLIDPALRGQGIGTAVAHDLIERARSSGIIMIKLSVLAANPNGLRFWKNLGFEFHRPAPALPGSDGHDRVVLKYRTRKDRT